MSVEIDQIQAAQGIPGFARKFVGDEINIVQTEDWTAPGRATSSRPSPASPAR